MSFERDARCVHGNTNPGGSGGCAECGEEELSDLSAFLRPTQRRHWDTIRWLVDDEGGRREGRSTILALAFIELADKHIGREITLWDHFASGPGDFMYEAVAELLLEIASLSKTWSTKEFEVKRSSGARWGTLRRVK